MGEGRGACYNSCPAAWLLLRNLRVKSPSPESNRANVPLPSGQPGRTFNNRQWVLQDNSLQMLPPLKKRSFNWSYFLIRTLGRLNPRRLF